MTDYIYIILDELPDDFDGTAATPATSYLLRRGSLLLNSARVYRSCCILMLPSYSIWPSELVMLETNLQRFLVCSYRIELHFNINCVVVYAKRDKVGKSCTNLTPIRRLDKGVIGLITRTGNKHTCHIYSRPIHFVSPIT
jgi:hypothetical protein